MPDHLTLLLQNRNELVRRLLARGKRPVNQRWDILTQIQVSAYIKENIEGALCIYTLCLICFFKSELVTCLDLKWMELLCLCRRRRYGFRDMNSIVNVIKFIFPHFHAYARKVANLTLSCSPIIKQNSIYRLPVHEYFSLICLLLNAFIFSYFPGWSYRWAVQLHTWLVATECPYWWALLKYLDMQEMCCGKLFLVFLGRDNMQWKVKENYLNSGSTIYKYTKPLYGIMLAFLLCLRQRWPVFSLENPPESCAVLCATTSCRILKQKGKFKV